MEAWIGVDLDGTLAEYHTWNGEEHIGKPVQVMVDRVKLWLGRGINVKIFTARASTGADQIKIIQDWLERQGLPRLEVTATKDYGMIEYWDDRAVQVESNTGRRADGRGEVVYTKIDDVIWQSDYNELSGLGPEVADGNESL